MYLDVLLLSDVHVDHRTESQNILSHLRIMFPGGQNERRTMKSLVPGTDISQTLSFEQTNRVRKPRHCACSQTIFLRKARYRFLTKNMRA